MERGYRGTYGEYSPNSQSWLFQIRGLLFRYEINIVNVKITMTKYFNKRSFKRMVYFDTAVYGGNEFGKSGHLFNFTYLKHLIMR